MLSDPRQKPLLRVLSSEPPQAPFWRDIYLGTLCRSVLTICPFAPQAGFENPSISLHVIGLNGPTHDLEMAPPDDPRMRSVTGRRHNPPGVYAGADTPTAH